MSRFRARHVWLLAVLLALQVSERVSEAVDLRNVLTDYTFTSWSRKDGLSGPVWAIAQDAEGFLWVANDEGLLRFDGVRFASWEWLGGQPLPRLPVRALMIAGDGTLWLGFGGAGGAARLRQRSVDRFDTPDAGITGTVTAFIEDESHTIWAASSDGLFAYTNDRWMRLGAADGLPDAAATSLHRRPDGGFWVGTAAGIYGKVPTSSRFDQVEAAADTLRSLSLSVDPHGTLWTSDPIVGVRAIGTPQVRGGETPSGRGYRILHDRRGDLWIGTIGQGLWRARGASQSQPIAVERATVLSGLSSDAVRSIFEDRDGNIWAGTTEGVDRLVPHRITPWTSLGLVSSIEATADQRIWVGTEDDLIRFSRTGRLWSPDGTRLPLRGIRALRADRQEGLWVLALDDLVRVSAGTATRVAYPPGIPVSWTEAIASDPKAGIWVAVISGEILRDEGDRLRVFDRIDAIRDARINSALADSRGRFWLGYSGSRVGVLSAKGHFKSYSPDDGLSPGPYYTIFEDRQGSIWVSGAAGVSRLDGERFVSVTSRAAGLPSGGVYSIAEDAAGFLWMATSGGVIRAGRDEFDAAAASGGAMHFRLYDTADGLAGFPALLGDHSGVRAHGGTLWFVTSRGLSIVDPEALADARPTPRVTVDELRADDLPVRSPTLPAGTSKIEVNYTAPDLTYPLKMRFRYRLDGFDRDWVDAGSRRQVLYTNLPPREYAFHVAVSSDEGRWTEAGTTLTFAIAPRFYQTFWFYPLCVLIGGGLIAGAWQLRLRQLRRQFSLVLGERVRLSRELHDTLLQSLVGVALEFDAVSKSLETSPATARERVVKIREHVEEYIREARRSIWSLRSPALETGDLIEALRESANRATADHDIALDFQVEGERRRLGPQIEHQILRIGQEAILNAARHANPESIRVLLRYDPDILTLRVTDDGTGFDPARTAEGTTDHYGITTMRERAQQAGGEVAIISAPGRGTTVEARVPIGRESAEEN